MDDTESLDSYAEQGLLLKYIGPGRTNQRETSRTSLVAWMKHA